MKLNIAKMIEAAKKFEGTHNFETFRAAACQSNQPVRHVSHCRLIRHGNYLVLDIQADGFLHHMVRNIMGALVYVGNKKLSVDDFAQLIEEKSRLKAPPTFMPDGLYLTGVDYPNEFNIIKADMPVWL